MAKKPQFSTWLQTKIDDETAADWLVDLAVDNLSEKWFPKLGSDYNSLRNHLIKTGAPRIVVRQFHDAYDEFYRECIIITEKENVRDNKNEEDSGNNSEPNGLPENAGTSEGLT